MAEHESDQTLLERLRRGDESAFDNLFVRHYAVVYRVVYGLTGTREAAEDAAQETFLALYRRPPAPDQPLRPWLCRVALNTARNALRAERRDTLRVERAALDVVAAGEPSEAVERAEERDRVRAALATLPQRQARLLLLRHAGLSYAEVAAALDLAPGSVGTLLARAERAFAEAYARSTSTGAADQPVGKQVQS
ncbi:sigma-70 family RNA polymerase sigma factor [Roseiflexus sp.]|jgi:RNA polymerase sigma-70 factor (ECF subfamily)|uniref:RNA polymerase sigma factor n=1 Tax=Roseiflexus sp. TaxID=2562120 RepID=UPI0025CEBD5F|nr:sigma-70 family RNA polymerase sigma factor [Roseiflexus sp.]